MIPYGKQTIDDQDIASVVAVLRSDFLTQGPAVPRFEAAIASRCNVPFAVAMSSATSALHVACMALGVGPEHRVWTSPNTFVASANCARYCGATVDFVDIDPDTLNLCPVSLATKLARAEANGELPYVVIPVHFAGQPCEMQEIHALSRRYGFRIIEDASHAIGARYADTVIGDCRYSDITVFSFHPVKIITTAEGGLATTKDHVLADRMNILRSHGITRDVARLENPDEGAWYYEQQSLGYNYRMTDIQAALGVSQLAHLDEWIGRRHQIADVYNEQLAGCPLILPRHAPNRRSALHLYVVQLDCSRARIDRKEFFNRLRQQGVGVNVHYIPVHLQPDFRRLGFKPGQFPRSEAYYAGCVSLPMFSGLTPEMQSQVIQCVRAALAQ